MRISVCLLLGLTLQACATPPAPLSPAASASPPTTVVVENASPTPALMQVSGDTCWILYRERAVDTEKREYDRHVLCLYQGSGTARQLELVDVREVTFDFKAVQLGQPRLQVKDLKQAWEREFLRREKQSPR